MCIIRLVYLHFFVLNFFDLQKKKKKVIPKLFHLNRNCRYQKYNFYIE